jgi:hypothetical protein
MGPERMRGGVIAASLRIGRLHPEQARLSMPAIT